MTTDSGRRIREYIDYDDSDEEDDLTETRERRNRKYESSGYDADDLEGDDTGSTARDNLAPSDDPVRMYLKEIGQVPLLDSNREMWVEHADRRRTSSRRLA